MQPRLAFLVAFVLALATTGPALAQGRPDTRNLTCAQVNALVQGSGVVVMNTGTYAYERFVASAGFCDRWERLNTETVPSLDLRQCVVEWICYDPRPASSR